MSHEWSWIAGGVAMTAPGAADTWCWLGGNRQMFPAVPSIPCCSGCAGGVRRAARDQYGAGERGHTAAALPPGAQSCVAAGCTQPVPVCPVCPAHPELVFALPGPDPSPAPLHAPCSWRSCCSPCCSATSARRGRTSSRRSCRHAALRCACYACWVCAELLLYRVAFLHAAPLQEACTSLSRLPAACSPPSD